MDDYRQLGQFVKEKCEAWTLLGIPPAEQRQRLAKTGIFIGGGGAGSDPSVPECGYCHAFGGGGHGGFCPNGPGTIEGESARS